jgi:hypothetical protein
MDLQETTPLLTSAPPANQNAEARMDVTIQAKLAAEQEHNIIYDRFSRGKKRSIVALISFCGVLPCS